MPRTRPPDPALRAPSSVAVFGVVGERGVTQDHIDAATPPGATLLPQGVAFRLWAPAAAQVHVAVGEPGGRVPEDWAPGAGDALQRRDDGSWTGFVAGLGDGTPYRFWVVGPGDAGFKRDPYARELGLDPPFPECDCIVRDAAGYPWHDAGWRTPAFHELVVYQLHFGAFHATDAHGHDVRRQRAGTFLDALFRIEHLRELGVNAIQPLPVQEYPSQFSMGYNGTDYFSPEMDYQVSDAAELARYLEKANALLAEHGHAPLRSEQLRPGVNQLKCLVDICHLNGIAVFFDVVYNHAGGGFDEQSLWFLDRREKRGVPVYNHEDSLYFTRSGWAGGLVFDYAEPGVGRFLADNARFLLQEYHADGLRYDEVTVMDGHGGWHFCQALAAEVREAKPEALQIAEYWNDPAWRWLAAAPPPLGMGFDAVLGDRLRDAVRAAVGSAARGREAHVEMGRVAAALQERGGLPAAWRTVQCLENHDIVYADRPPHEWQPRLAHLADGADARSWYARSRARAATGLLLTAPGIPMLFMGQEILEHRNWTDNRDRAEGTLVDWAALEHDRARRDHLAFVRDLVHLRRRLPALRGERIHAYHAHDATRVLAFHRWIDDAGHDVVVVASLSEQTFARYALGFPLPGRWAEVFNSDHYDHLPNPWVAGNGGAVVADGPPLHGLPASAAIVLPANGLLVFAREG